jgi:hypothetical protein
MGMDSFFMAKPDRELQFPASIFVNGAFRTQPYARIIERITGQSLYEEEIKPEIVAQMAQELRREIDRYTDLVDHRLISRQEDNYYVTIGALRALVKLFEFAAEEGLYLRRSG